MDHSKAVWLVGGALAVLSVTGCGGSDGDGNEGGGPGSKNGTVTAEWASYCTGTFTEDMAIVDAFDEPAFTAHAGEQYLMSDFDDSFGGHAEFLYMTSAGPDTFEVEPTAEGTWPFTSNCTIGAGLPYYAVFKDVSVFAEKELTTKICDLSEGTVLSAAGVGRGYAFSATSGGSAIYELILGPFSAQCGGQSSGYISVPQTRSFGSTTWLVPVVGIIGPQ